MKITTLALAASALLLSGQAHAGIEACGNIDVSAQAECEMRLEAECMVACEPLQFRAACSAELYADCDAMCDGTFSAECTGACQGGCEAECDVDPGSFDCSATCQGNCEADCSASCEAEASGSEARAKCEASCSATCDGECEASCEGTPPSAECEAQCGACCQGECNAEVNIDCQIACQADLYAGCESEISGGCEADCQAPEGALFCDGQYVDHGGNLEECVASLKAVLDIEVDGYAYGEAECMGNTCTASGEAGASVSCAWLPGAVRGAGSTGLGTAPLLLGAWLRRRRRATQRAR